VSAPRVAITAANAITEIAFALGYHGGELPVFIDGARDPAQLLDCEQRTQVGERLARIAAAVDLERSGEVAIGLPTVKGYVQNSTVLWCWVKSGEQVKRAASFKPVPSIVLKVGAQSNERLLLWVLRKPLTCSLVEPYNAKIAYCLHAPRTRCHPEQLRVPLPGTFMRIGRSVPQPILVTRLDFAVGHEATKVIHGLKDPPPRDAWKQAVKR
jgi:hypothetical protein